MQLETLWLFDYDDLETVIVGIAAVCTDEFRDSEIKQSRDCFLLAVQLSWSPIVLLIWLYSQLKIQTGALEKYEIEWNVRKLLMCVRIERSAYGVSNNLAELLRGQKLFDMNNVLLH